MRGAVFSFVVVHQRHHPAFETPYNVAVVESKKGYVWSPPSLGSLMKTSGGMPVEVGFEDVAEEISLPRFRPASGGEGLAE